MTPEIKPEPTLKPKLLNRTMLADYLSISASQISRLWREQKIPEGLKLVGNRRWDISEIDEWIGAKCPDRQTWQSMKP